jgi:cytochrome P450
VTIYVYAAGAGPGRRASATPRRRYFPRQRSAGFTDDPYPHYAAVRAAAPVYLHPLGFWLLTGYQDASSLLRDGGMSVEDRNMTDSPLQQLREATYGDGAGQPAEGLSMLDRDPPDHTRLRKLVSKAFTPRAIQALRPRITELVDGMLDAMAQARRVDLVDDRSRCRSP